MSGGHHIGRDNLAAYALGGLPAAESESVESHIADCETCVAALRDLGPALDVLSGSVEQIEPPPELRDRLLAITRSEAAAPAPAATPQRRQWRRRLGDRRLRIGRFALAPAGGLAIVAIAVLAVLGGYLVSRDDGTGSTKTVTVSSKLAGSTAELEVSKTSATLQAHHVPTLPAGGVYQVWVAYPGKAPEPSSVFRPSADGTAAAAIPEVLHGAEQVMVTREPGPGSKAPSGPPVYSATLSS